MRRERPWPPSSPWLGLAFAAAAIGLQLQCVGGTQGTPSSCGTGPACRSGWLCVDEQCRQLCVLDSDCPSDEPRCRDGSCREALVGDCAADSDCKAPTACQTAAGATCVSHLCHYVTLAPGTACNDQDPCTYGDACDAGGGCVGTPIVCSDDPNPCGTRRACNGTDACVLSLPGAEVTCDDGTLCTYGDHCNGAGACVGTPITCTSDVGACSLERSCNGTSTCATSYPSGTPCDNGDPCDGADACDGAGACKPVGPALTCDDQDACTNDWCIPGSGCAHSAITTGICSACASGKPTQVFGAAIAGCAGAVSYAARDSLCAYGYATCPAGAWLTTGGVSPPAHDYWTSDSLTYGSDADGCWVSLTNGSTCIAGMPMRVCAPSEPDPEGNNCNWTDCGYEVGAPDLFFGGCNDNPTAGTLCCPTLCADGSEEEVFAAGMVGCAGQVGFADRDSLCANGASACAAADWVSYSAGAVPHHNYWTNDALYYGGTASGSCLVSDTPGTSCGTSPMRLCADTTDPEGNTCTWVECGWEATTPSLHFGGCLSNPTAGTLCCNPAW